MHPAMFHKRTSWVAIIVCSCFVWCIALVDQSAALQVVPDTAELRLVALPVPSTFDQVSALPTSQTSYITGDTFYVELWAQTTAASGLVQASADVAFNPGALTAISVTHTSVFDIFPAGSINNVAGTIDNVSGSHTPVQPACSDQVGAAPFWARVAVIEMRARSASMTTITLMASNDQFFVVANCNSLVVVPSTYVSVGVEIRAPLATVNLVALPVASASDLATSLPVSQPGFVLGDPFVLEMWAQTDSANGLAQVSADIAFDPTLVNAGTVTHSTLFNLFSAGSVNNFTGTIGNLSGAHPPVIPSCSDSVGTTPNWARVATVSMSAAAVGSLTIQSADANDLIFLMAVCGSEVSPVTTFGGVAVAVTLCGNGVLEPGEDCDDGNLLAGDCCSSTCTFESTTTVCRGAANGCDAVEFCDGAGACPLDSFQPTGTPCGNAANTICDGADTCDGSGVCLVNIAPITTECRAVNGDCDVAEFCDGAGACPTDSFRAAGTACGDPAANVCDNPDTCDTGGTCLPNFATVTVLCRVAVDDCDAPEFCNGAGACPANGFQIAGTPCGDPANTLCDNPDSCDGGGICLPNLEAATTVCRGATSDCDVTEFCDGLGRCPIDDFLAAGTACGNPSDTACDNPDTCDASGTCLPNPELLPIVCRTAASACDVEEVCDGSGACPADTFQPAGVACGDPSVTVCDGADTCDGAGACQPNFESTVTMCRAAAPACDVAEFCDGAGGCPVDAFEPVGTACGDPTATVCDKPDSCNGAGVCLSNPEPAVTVCRAAVGECDVVELCDGLGQCPADVFVLAGMGCGDPSATVCDQPDTCDGTGVCQPNYAQPTTSCRAPVGDCDAEDFCDGVGNCPADAFLVAGAACGDPTTTVCDGADSCNGAGVCLPNPAPVTTLCRAAGGICDVAEFCDGAGLCPSDAKALGECRAAAGECDVAEFCDGVVNNCPADDFVATGVACGDPTATVCDKPDTCSGTGLCQSNLEPPTVSCRVAVGECDAEDFCDGAGNCPTDAFQVAGTACGDPTVTVCDAADTCDGVGTCQPNPAPLTTICRDAGGVCDVAEFCDGAGLCPSDVKKSSECRAAVSECDVAEVCDGVANSCPVDVFVPTGTSCGDPIATACDLPDSCDGTGSCQPNYVLPVVSCRAAVGECDAEDFCDGAGNCPTDAFQVAGTPCGDPAVTVCDAADTCDGVGSCQSNPAPATTVCRQTGGVCDLTEFCDGAGLCPPDAKKVSECRAAAGECDVAEFCDGATNNCPPDAFVLTGTACGDPSDTVCDRADTCDGTGVCQTHIEPPSTSCRPAAGECDVAEFCDGAGQCPVDQFKSVGISCGNPVGSVCDNPDSCDGFGVCLTNPEPITTVCRGSIGDCDIAELCDGVGGCPTDAFVSVGLACGDPTTSLCNNADTCDGAGTCLDNFVVDGTSCSDGLFCNGEELCLAGLCQSSAPFCADVCEHCSENSDACAWCIFDHNFNGTMDGFDFAFFSGCFGVCVPPEDPCFAANYDTSPDGCVGGGDFGAFSGCFSVGCASCLGCSGPAASGGSGRVASSSSAARVRLVTVGLPQNEDVSALLPTTQDAFTIHERFSLEVWATLSGDPYDGLGSVYVDLTYDPLLLEVEEMIPSDSFSLFSRGTVDSSLGIITALGGCAPVGEGAKGSQSTWARVATLRLRALGVGSTTVAAEPSYGPYGVSVYGRFGDLPSQRIEFGVAELRIQGRRTERPKRGMRWHSSR